MGQSTHIGPVLASLSASASCPDWVCLENINAPLHQHHLSGAIDEAIQAQLLASAPSIWSRALTKSTSLPHAGDWLNSVQSPTLGLHLQDQEFCCCLKYWLGVPLPSTPYPCLSAMEQQTNLGTIRSAIAAMQTIQGITTPSMMPCLWPPSQLYSPPHVKPLV